MQQQTPTTWKRATARREEGAAMLVVMLVLLVGTTIATMTVHAISLEIRSAGYYRQQAQTHYTAESALLGMLSVPAHIVVKDAMDAEFQALAAQPVDVTNINLITNYGEPDPFYVGAGKKALRYGQDRVESSLTAVPGGGVAVLQGNGNSIGYQAFMPWYVADVTDFQVASVPIAGQDASGNTTSAVVDGTVTVRGRTILEMGGVPAPDLSRGESSTVAGNIIQRFTDAAYDMRVVVRFGPVGTP